MKKSAEHWKKVLQKQEVPQKRSVVSFEEIFCDQGEGKVSSHNRIATYINKFGQDAFQRIYTKQ